MAATESLGLDPGHAAGEAIYVYGVTRPAGAVRRAGAGIAGTDVGVIEHRGLAAIVSPVADGSMQAKRRDLLGHTEVLQAAFASAPVLPLRFGTVFADGESLVAGFLEPRRDELLALLKQFDGLAELRVRALYREERILAEVVRADERIAGLRERVRAGGGHGLQVQLGEAVAAALRARRRADADALVAALASLARDMAADEPVSELEVLRGSFLVERKRIPSFDARMDELARAAEGRMTFRYTGPLPPHSFVSLSPGRGG